MRRDDNGDKEEEEDDADYHGASGVRGRGSKRWRKHGEGAGRWNSSRAAATVAAEPEGQKKEARSKQASNSSGRSKRGFTPSVEQGCGQKVCGAVCRWGCHGGEVANL